jgi:hypothetical protein
LTTACRPLNSVWHLRGGGGGGDDDGDGGGIQMVLVNIRKESSVVFTGNVMNGVVPADACRVHLFALPSEVLEHLCCNCIDIWDIAALRCVSKYLYALIGDIPHFRRLRKELKVTFCNEACEKNTPFWPLSNTSFALPDSTTEYRAWLQTICPTEVNWQAVSVCLGQQYPRPIEKYDATFLKPLDKGYIATGVAASGNLDVLFGYLLTASAVLKKRCFDMAAKHGRVGAIRLMLTSPSLSCDDFAWCDSIGHAAGAGQMEALTLMLDLDERMPNRRRNGWDVVYNGDPDICHKSNYSHALAMAVENGQLDALELLIKRPAMPDILGAFQKAVLGERLDAMRLLKTRAISTLPRLLNLL